MTEQLLTFTLQTVAKTGQAKSAFWDDLLQSEVESEVLTKKIRDRH